MRRGPELSVQHRARPRRRCSGLPPSVLNESSRPAGHRKGVAEADQGRRGHGRCTLKRRPAWPDNASVALEASLPPTPPPRSGTSPCAALSRACPRSGGHTTPRPAPPRRGEHTVGGPFSGHPEGGARRPESCPAAGSAARLDPPLPRGPAPPAEPPGAAVARRSCSQPGGRM